MSESIPYETPGPVEDNWRDAISSIEEIIEDARNGRMFILVDHEDRENEGDLVIPAQMATPEIINFMATHGRGLICLSLPGERIDALGLPLMASDNSSRHETAFTISIEAREGVSTGVSAADRVTTIRRAIADGCRPEDLARPGHVFPIRAHAEGLAARQGHSEATIELVRRAGLKPAGVLCEVTKPDGTMARLPEILHFSEAHGMPVLTIDDLVDYRKGLLKKAG